MELTPAQVQRITKVQQALKEVDRSPLKQWVDNFKRDVNPDDEIELWEVIAAAYTAYTANRSLGAEAKKDVFLILLLRSAAPEAEVLRKLKLKVLSQAEAREVLALYQGPSRPITVERK
jgi:hypothetical protein